MSTLPFASIALGTNHHFASRRTPQPETLRHRPPFRWRRMSVMILCVAAALIVTNPRSRAAAAVAPLRVCLVAPNDSVSREVTSLQSVLTKSLGNSVSLLTGDPSAKAVLTPLRDAELAIFVQGPGKVSAADVPILREFLHSGKGLVVIAASAQAWPSEPQFQQEVLGGVQNGIFAAGAAMTVINLFPHAIFTGITSFDSTQPLPLFEKLSDDVQLIMEGTVGEATAPMAWLRSRQAGRVCHIVPGGKALFTDPAFQTLVTNAALWCAGRPIPGARPAVQRTFMPDSYPGSFAITFPNGPSVCLDPVRGGINYVWDGDFVDLRPRWITKQGEPARLFGEIFYREKEWQPLRSGAPNDSSTLHFRGFTLQDGYPEFHYEVGGRDIYEKLTAGSNGTGLLRHFRVGPGKSPLWITLEPQPNAVVTVQGLERDGNLAAFSSPAGGEFTIEIRRQAVSDR